MTTENALLQQMPDEVPVFRDIHMDRLVPGDAADIDAMLTRDPGIRDWITWIHDIEGEAAIAQAITAMDPTQTRQYGIKEGDKLVGYAAISVTADATPGVYDVAYFLDKPARGQGVITKAISALLMVAISRLQASQFRAYIADDNEASQRIATALHFTRTEEEITDPKLGRKERRWEKVIDE